LTGIYSAQFESAGVGLRSQTGDVAVSPAGIKRTTANLKEYTYYYEQHCMSQLKKLGISVVHGLKNYPIS
jgi:hypothetical protein